MKIKYEVETKKRAGGRIGGSKPTRRRGWIDQNHINRYNTLMMLHPLPAIDQDISRIIKCPSHMVSERDIHCSNAYAPISNIQSWNSSMIFKTTRTILRCDATSEKHLKLSTQCTSFVPHPQKPLFVSFKQPVRFLFT